MATNDTKQVKTRAELIDLITEVKAEQSRIIREAAELTNRRSISKDLKRHALLGAGLASYDMEATISKAFLALGRMVYDEDTAAPSAADGDGDGDGEVTP